MHFTCLYHLHVDILTIKTFLKVCNKNKCPIQINVIECIQNLGDFKSWPCWHVVPCKTKIEFPELQT